MSVSSYDRESEWEKKMKDRFCECRTDCLQCFNPNETLGSLRNMNVKVGEILIHCKSM